MNSLWIPVSLKERLCYIDALRAFLMTYGIILHANMFLQGPIRDFIGDSSHIFRMQTFFIVSGFFTAMIFIKSSAVSTYARRFASILVPFALFAIFANPFANYVLAQTAGSTQSFGDLLLHGPAAGLEPPLGITWHLHLWFLVVLAAFTAFYPAIMWLLRLPPVLKLFQLCIEKIRWRSLSFFLIACAIAMTSVFLRGSYFVTVESHMAGNPFNHILVSILEFLPFFILGTALFIYKPLFDIFHHLFYGQFLITLLALFSLYYFSEPLTNALGEVGFELCMRVASAFCSVYSANFLFNFFSRFLNTRGTVAKFLSDAAYSVYLLHLYILIGIYYFFYEPGHSSRALYIGSVLLTYATCLLLHRYVISRFAITRALINGKFKHKEA